MRIFHSERLKRRDRRTIPSIFGAIARRDLSNKNYSFQIVDGPADYLAPCADGRRELERSNCGGCRNSAVASLPARHHRRRHPGYLRAALRLISPLSRAPRYIKPARVSLVWTARDIFKRTKHSEHDVERKINNKFIGNALWIHSLL